MTDRAKRATDLYTDSSGRLRDAQGRFAAAASQSESALGRFRNSLGGTSRALGTATRQTGGLIRQVAALGTAYLGVQAVQGLFSKTIGAAANYEMNKVSFDAMFGKDYTKQAGEYLAFLQERADISSLELSDFITGGRSVIPLTKDVEQLKKATNLMERLAALDPLQGMEGSSLAIREMLSGDSQSLVERFEMPRKVLNDIKNLDIADQLRELDKLFEKMGASNELIEAQSKTSLGQYNKAIGRITTSLREMGTRGLDKIAPLLRDFNKWLDSADFEKLKAWGSDVFSGFVSGAVNMVRKATDYLNTNFINNPEFQRLPDIQAKIKYIFNTLWDDFTAWYNTEGRAKVQAIATDLTNTLGAALSASPPALLGGGAAAKFLGGGGGKGGKVAALAINPYVVGGGAALAAMGYSSSVWESVKSNPDSIYSSKVIGGGSNAPVVPNTTKITESQVDTLVGHLRGHNGGLLHVPYNGYTASLHSGEAVLTREEAKRWRGESGANYGDGGSGSVVITGNTFHVREEADIQKIARQLAYAMAR
ncbi:hypothetical protein [Paenibacillus sp. LBL]|uniref:hypothetical protein n=1 Tax=Paenibacillus sp. LBL TaxID=2940563 RepID=UPI0024734853|nr:hypothetical protein [Paenibacillus sp. LBL]